MLLGPSTLPTSHWARWRSRGVPRHPHGFRIRQLARDGVFETPSGKAQFSSASLPDDVDPGGGRLLLATVRSHDQFQHNHLLETTTAIGAEGLRTVVFLNEVDMHDRDIDDFDLIDVTSFSRDGTQRTVFGYRAVRYEVPPGCAAGHMPELKSFAAWPTSPARASSR